MKGYEFLENHPNLIQKSITVNGEHYYFSEDGIEILTLHHYDK